jgi:thioredoxin-disulfide reductase
MDKSYDLIIVGGGPAGITAGIYATRQRIKTLLITKSFGGQMAQKAVGIENYPGIEEISGLELIQKMEKHLRKRAIDILTDSVKEIKKTGQDFSVTTTEQKQFTAKAVIVATGADPRPLEIEGEKDFIGKGVSYCVACDGPIYADKTVAVVGGGNAGLEAAISLSKYAKKIYILEYGDKIKADAHNQEHVKKIANITIITKAALKKIQGQKFVDAVVYEERDSKKIITLPVQGLFVEIGSQPATSFIKGLAHFNERDEIIVDPRTGETSLPGLFSAGDADDVPYKQIIIACGEGAKAALSTSIYLQKNGQY